ncbi:MAG: hypothetical protein EPN89_20185, partial [Methylovulum sp.]
MKPSFAMFSSTVRKFQHVLRLKLTTYWVIARANWVQSFTYPVSFWMWRARQVIQIVISLSVWEAVFATSALAFGYRQAQMLTYIFVANITGFIVFSSRTIDVSNVIHSGDLSLYLVKPLNFFLNWFSRDIADKLLNLIFSACELTI